MSDNENADNPFDISLFKQLVQDLAERVSDMTQNEEMAENDDVKFVINESARMVREYAMHGFETGAMSQEEYRRIMMGTISGMVNT